MKQYSVPKFLKLGTCAWQEEMKPRLQNSNPRRKVVITEPEIWGFQVKK